LNQEQVINRGLKAERLLNDEDFQSFHDELKSLISDSLFNTKPEEDAQRERLYFLHQGLTDMVGVMESFIAAKDQILADQETERDD
jgi:hypothetical protein